MCCGLLSCVVVGCHVLWYGVMWCGVMWCGVVWWGIVRYGWLAGWLNGGFVKVAIAMKDTMEAKDRTPEIRVRSQPPDTLPSDTWLHCPLVALPFVLVQVNAPLHAQLWDNHQHASLHQLHSAGVWAPTIVSLSEQPADAYWQWAQASPVPLVLVTAVLPPWPWIAIAPAAVVKYKYPAECVAHRCPGHLHKGPLYYLLSTARTVPAELYPALRNNLREHHGDLACLALHSLATDPCG